MSRVNSAWLDLGLNDVEWGRGAARVRKTMRSMQQNMDAVARQARVMLLAGAGAFAGLIKLASDFEEDTGKFRAVFKENSDQVLEWARITALATQRSTSELVRFLSSVQDTFVPLGFARDKAAALSQQVVQLAIDLGSFNNEAEPQVIQALTSALVGQHKAVQRYGIVINEATIKTKAYEQGVRKSVKEMTPAEKAMARLGIIIDSTSDAQGDAVRTSGSFANQLRGLTSEAKDLGVEIGTKLLPTVTEWVKQLRITLPVMAEWIETNQSMIVNMVKWGAAALAVAVILPKLTVVFSLLIAAGEYVVPVLLGIGGALATLSAPLVVIIAAFTALMATMVGIVVHEKNLKDAIEESAEAAKESAEKWLELKAARDELEGTEQGTTVRLNTLGRTKDALNELKQEQIAIAKSDAPWYLRNNAAGNAIKLNAQMREIAASIARMQHKPAEARQGSGSQGSGTSPAETAEVAAYRKEVMSLTEKLQIQAETWGMTSEAAQVYEVQRKKIQGVDTLALRLAAQNIEFLKKEDELWEDRKRAMIEEAQIRADRRDSIRSEVEALKDSIKTDAERTAEFKKRIKVLQDANLLTQEQVNKLLALRKEQEAIVTGTTSLEGAYSRINEAAASRRAVSGAADDGKKTAEDTARAAALTAERTGITNEKLDQVIAAVEGMKVGFGP